MVLPEQRLLVLCAAGAAATSLFREEALRVTDWPFLLSIADSHKLLPLLADAIHEVSVEVPPEIAFRLREARLDSAGRALIASIALPGLLKLLRQERVRVVPFKGPVLAEFLYLDPCLRPFSDLDLVVPVGDIQSALTILGGRGYAVAGPFAKLPVRDIPYFTGEVLLEKEGALPVDLHWTLFSRGCPWSLDPEIFWRDAEAVGVERDGIAAEALLLFLCGHGTKHMWSRLGWLADISRVAGLNPDWDSAMGLASREGCLRPVLLGLLLAHDLLGAAIPEWIVGRARAERGIGELARQVVSRLETWPPKEPPRSPEHRGAECAVIWNWCCGPPRRMLKRFVCRAGCSFSITRCASAD